MSNNHTIHYLDQSHRRQSTDNDRGIITVINAADVHIEPINWLWQGWLATGKFHLIAGAPSTGKTTVCMALAATVSTGGCWADGTCATAGHTLIWSGEDDPQDTLVPRLIAAGANLTRIHFITGYVNAKGHRNFDPAKDAAALSEYIAKMSVMPTLLIVDPIVSAVTGDSHKNAEVRRSLQPLVDLALSCRCAVLGVSHFSKGSTDQDPINRVTGSLAFGALARVILATARRSDEQGGGRILARAKSNIGPDTGGFGYELAICQAAPGIETTRIVWGAALEGSARDLLAAAEYQSNPEERNATTEAMDWLREQLRHGAVKVADVQREARAAGISDKALRTARERLGIKSSRAGFQGGYQWAIPPANNCT